jgi:RNA polymerase sigma-70 factor (ECF subfamily)
MIALNPTSSPSRIADPRPWLGLFVLGLQPVVANAHTDSTVQTAASNADASDVRAARGGDDAAFERIVRRHQQEIAQRLRRFSRDPLVIEQLVQETFVQAFLSLRSYRADAPLVHWLHRIAVRAGYRYWKTERSRPRTVSIDDRPLTAPRPSEPDDRLDRVMAKLPPRDRLVLTLLYLDDHSVASAAALTGWSRTLVKVQAFRARAKLRKLMNRERERSDG